MLECKLAALLRVWGRRRRARGGASRQWRGHLHLSGRGSAVWLNELALPATTQRGAFVERVVLGGRRAVLSAARCGSARGSRDPWPC